MRITKILELVALVSIIFGIVLAFRGTGFVIMGMTAGSYLKFSAICLLFAIVRLMNQLLEKEK